MVDADVQGRTVGSTEPFRLPSSGVPMSDKSPRQNMSKKSGKSIKEKRAEKRDGVQAAHDKARSEVKKR